MIANQDRPVIFGEVLFDEYPDGSRHLGGAPYNVAWHLQGFEQRPIFISRIGQDEAGELAIMAMRQWQMDSIGVQIDVQHPTGKVRVIKDGDDVLFKIEDEQAYDYISSVLSVSMIRDRPTSLIYTGSLALRHETSRKTFNTLCVESKLPRFIDVNLRPPWSNTETIKQVLQGANWVKINEDELRQLLGRDISSSEDLRIAADIFRRSHAIEHVYITRGSKGACYCAHETWLSRKPPVDVEVTDPVGAGDAFSAVCILGIQLGWSYSQSLERAMQFAGKVCAQKGANSDDKSLYSEMLASWQD